MIEDPRRLCREHAARERQETVGSYEDAATPGTSTILRPSGSPERRSRLFSRMVSRRHGHWKTRRVDGRRRVPGSLCEPPKQARPRPYRDTVVAWPAPSCLPKYARLCHDGPVRSSANAIPPPKKPSGRLRTGPGSVVDTVNPPRLHPTRVTADKAGAGHRVVSLATVPPGHRTGIPFQVQNATVMLVRTRQFLPLQLGKKVRHGSPEFLGLGTHSRKFRRQGPAHDLHHVKPLARGGA